MESKCSLIEKLIYIRKCSLMEKFLNKIYIIYYIGEYILALEGNKYYHLRQRG